MINADGSPGQILLVYEAFKSILDTTGLRKKESSCLTLQEVNI